MWLPKQFSEQWQKGMTSVCEVRFRGELEKFRLLSFFRHLKNSGNFYGI